MEKLLKTHQTLNHILENPSFYFNAIGNIHTLTQDDILQNGIVPITGSKKGMIACAAVCHKVHAQYHPSFKKTKFQIQNQTYSLNEIFDTNANNVKSQEEENKETTQKFLDQLTPLSDKACFGNLKTGETVHDETVRKGFDVLLTNKKIFDYYDEDFKLILSEFVHDYLFPYAKGIQVTPYKINIYREGDFFASHQDAPKPSDTVATLMMILPTEYTGGDFIMKHEHKSMKVTHQSYTQLVVFTNDVMHEVQPVTSGVRITITFKCSLLKNPLEYNREEFSLSENIEDVRKLKFTPMLPKIHDNIGYILSHQYTLTNLTPESLKGADRSLYNYYVSTTDGKYNIELVCVLCNEEYQLDEQNVPFFRTGNVYICNEEDFIRAIEHNEKSSHKLQTSYKFYRCGYAEDHESLLYQTKTKYIPYVGNEAEMGEFRGVYFTAAMILTRLNDEPPTKKAKLLEEDEDDDDED